MIGSPKTGSESSHHCRFVATVGSSRQWCELSVSVFGDLQSFSDFKAKNRQWRVIIVGSLATDIDGLALKIDYVVVMSNLGTIGNILKKLV